jgi:acyl-CoA thioesterase
VAAEATGAERPTADRANWRHLELAYRDSPIHESLGLRLLVRGAGEVEIQYDGSAGALNRWKIVAGGALATMVDSAVMQACRTLLDHDDVTTTIELKTNFLRAVAQGEPLRAVGTLEHIGRTTAMGIARVKDSNGRTVAFGTATIAVKRGG